LAFVAVALIKATEHAIKFLWTRTEDTYHHEILMVLWVVASYVSVAGVK
jgi:hypothetical protein